MRSIRLDGWQALGHTGYFREDADTAVGNLVCAGAAS